MAKRSKRGEPAFEAAVRAVAAQGGRSVAGWLDALRLVSLTSFLCWFWRDESSLERLKGALGRGNWGAVRAQLNEAFGEALEGALFEAEGIATPGLPGLSPLALGAEYARLLGQAEAWVEGRQGVNAGQGRKRRGAYFTPASLAEALAEESLGYGAWADGACHRICDPACGSGVLLCSAVRAARTKGVDSPHLLIYGVDLDATAVELARLSVWVESGAPKSGLAALREQIVVGNALIGPPPPGVPWRAQSLPEKGRALDWGLAFPEVWSDGGFALIWSNPPWERVKFQARDLLRDALPAAASAATSAEREVVLASSARGREVKARLADEKLLALEISKSLRDGGSFPLSAHGDLNTYPLFVERALQALSPDGIAGLIVPTGLATDYGHRRLFSALRSRRSLAALWDFENRAKLFPGVDSRMRFSLVMLTPGRAGGGVDRVGTLLQTPDERHQPALSWSIEAEEMEAVNPETGALPLFRSATTRARGLEMHERGVTMREPGGWRLRPRRLFDMTNDAKHFHSLCFEGAVPLYEGKLFWQHEGAFATFKGVDESGRRRGRARSLGEGEGEVEPRFWVPAAEVEARGVSVGAPTLVIRALTNPTNARTLVAAMIPGAAVGNSALVLEVEGGPSRLARQLCLCANLNALVLDDLARQKMGNTNVNMFMLRQLPLIPWSRYASPLFAKGPTLGELVCHRVARLGVQCTALRVPFRAMGYGAPPAVESAERRRLVAELDAIYATLYGVRDEELEGLLLGQARVQGFPAWSRAEVRRHGVFLSAEECLLAKKTIEMWSFLDEASANAGFPLMASLHKDESLDR